jgi:hypothetical protein
MKKLIIVLVIIVFGLSSCDININIPFIPVPEECPLP